MEVVEEEIPWVGYEIPYPVDGWGMGVKREADRFHLQAAPSPCEDSWD